LQLIGGDNVKQLIKFSRPACVPCQMVGNFLNDKGVTYQEVNVYEDAETANKYNIQSVPVLVLVNGDDVEEMVFGYKPDEIEQLLSKL
jgi:thioredoxin 1